jgi:photosystem II stability/assembly factor-like uncharacterized protein
MADQYGIHRSTDDGLTWTSSNEGIEVNDLGPLMTHTICPELVWVGTQCERGLFASANWGESLEYIDEYMHYLMVPRVSESRPNELWVTTDDVLKKSVDLGESWETLDPDTLDFHMHGLDVHPTDGDVALAGTVGSGDEGSGDISSRLFRTDDGGLTWELSNEGLPETEESVHAIHFSREDPDVALAGTFRGGDLVHQGDGEGFGMFRSTDQGHSWSQTGPTDVADAPVFAECRGRIFAATDQGLLSSDDEGATWTLRQETDSDFLSVACHEELALAIDEGQIYRSDDRGETWTEWGSGLEVGTWTLRQMPQVAISADGRMGYAAVPNAGLFVRPL